MRVTLPRPSSRIVVGASLGAGAVDVTARSQHLSEPLTVTVSGEAGQPHYVSFDLPGPESQVDVDLSRPGEIFFVGYEG